MAAEDTASDTDNAETSDADERTLSIGSPDSSRRKFMVAGAATWASVGLAGCSGGGGDDDGNESDDGTGDGTEPEPQPENYVVTDSMRTGSEYVPEGAGGFSSGCAVQRQFAPGMQPVWYVGIYDPSSGENISADEVDSVVISTNNSTIGDVELAFSEEDGEWHGSTVLPSDIEAGTVTYTVEVSSEASTTPVSTLAKEFQIISMEDVAASYVVTDETYAIDDRGNGYVSSCLPNHTYDPSMGVGFDFGIWHTVTGEMVGPSDVESVELQFEAGDPDTLELVWGPGSNDDGEPNSWSAGDGPGEADHGWNAVWRGIPSDYSGNLEYEVVITQAGDGPEEKTTEVGIYNGYINVIQQPDSTSSSS